MVLANRPEIVIDPSETPQAEGSTFAKLKFGKRCTAADVNGLKESSYVWVISKDALKSFDDRVNKSNCAGS